MQFSPGRPQNDAMKIKTILLAIFATFLTACQAVFFTGFNIGAGSDEVVSTKGVVFNAEHNLKLDIYQPAGKVENAPVLIFIYGGGWTSGKREWYRFVGNAFAEAGYVTLIPDYRKGDKVPFPGFMFDTAEAVAWTADHVADYGGDPRKIFLSGHSAGGHIAVLLATDSEYLESVNVQSCQLRGVIGNAGAYDFLPLTSDRYRQVFGDKQSQQRSQPINYASADDPPLLLIQGLDDTTVAPKNARNMVAAIQQAGGSAEAKYYEGATHSGTLLALANKSRDKNPAFADTIEFMERQLSTDPVCK